MADKYPVGAKVKIRRGGSAIEIANAHLKRYGNLTGTVTESRTVIAYRLESGSWALGQLQMYTVELDSGVALREITEYCLEEA